MYICKKKPNADLISQEKFTKVYYELEKQQLMEDLNDYEGEGDSDENSESTKEEKKENIVANKN